MKALLVLLVLVVPVTLGNAAVASPGSAPHLATQIDSDAGPAWFAVDLTTGLTLYNDSGDTQLAPASTAKLVTVLTAKPLLGLNDQVTIVEADLVGEEFSKMGLEPGDVVTVEQLLYGALVPSGGDAARALARTAGLILDPATEDPVERFVQEMNTVAASIGMTNSSFGNPIGKDDDRSWTTARDLVRAGELVLDDPLLSTIVRTPWASMVISGPSEREVVLENTNQFVLFDDAIGIKTGTTDAAGQNLVAAFEFGDHVIVTVVLGSEDRYADTTAMLDSIRENWTWLTLGRNASSLGATDELSAAGLWMPVSRTILIRSGIVPSLTYDVVLEDGAMGMSKGRVLFKLDGSTVAELPAYPIGEPGE